MQFGTVRDTIILKDKVTGQPRGCAFVSYATKEEAEAAIAALDKGVHLPGALCPLEVSSAGAAAGGRLQHSNAAGGRAVQPPPCNPTN
jgi:CUG-BP- and ETR3-like factor